MQEAVIDIIKEPVLEETIFTGSCSFYSKTFVKAEIKTAYINQDPEVPSDKSSSESDITIQLILETDRTHRCSSKASVKNSIPKVFDLTPKFFNNDVLEPNGHNKEFQVNLRQFSFMNTPVMSEPEIIVSDFQLQLHDLYEPMHLKTAFQPNQILSDCYSLKSDDTVQSFSGSSDDSSDQEDQNQDFFGEPSWQKQKSQSHYLRTLSKIQEEVSSQFFVQSLEVELKSNELLPPEDDYYNQFQKEIERQMQSNCQIQKVPKARAVQKKIRVQKEKQQVTTKSFGKKLTIDFNSSCVLEDVSEEDSNYFSPISKSNPSQKLSLRSRVSRRTNQQKINSIRSVELDQHSLETYDLSEIEKELQMDKFIIPARYSAEGIKTYSQLQKQIVALCIKVGVDPTLYSKMFQDESYNFGFGRGQVDIPKRLCSEKKCVAKLHEMVHQNSMQSMITQQLKEAQVLDTQKELQWMKVQTNILTKRIINFHEEETKRVRQMNQLLAINIKQNQCIQSLMRKNKAEKKDLHFAFMFACPLVLSFAAHNETKFQMVPQLNYRKEFQIIKQKLAECKAKVTITSQQCTIESLQQVLRQKPLGIHFSGHGIKNTFDNVGEFHYQQQNEGDFLLLETLEGDSKLVSRQKLQNLISTAQCKLDFVVVATCHSEFVGRIFLEAGAEHVICIRNSDEVADEVVLHFTSTFYSAVFSQKESICKAFEYAQLSVKINHNAQEAGAFKLLLQNKRHFNQTVKDCHKCFVFGPFSSGNYTVREPYDVTFKMPSQRQIEVVG